MTQDEQLQREKDLVFERHNLRKKLRLLQDEGREMGAAFESAQFVLKAVHTLQVHHERWRSDGATLEVKGAIDQDWLGVPPNNKVVEHLEDVKATQERLAQIAEIIGD